MSQPAQPSVLPQIQSRVQAMGLPIVRLDGLGQASVEEPSSQLARDVVSSPRFAEAVKELWHELTSARVQPVEPLPGVCLVRLPQARKPLPGESHEHERIFAAMVLSEDLPSFEALHDTQPAGDEPWPGVELTPSQAAANIASMLVWMHDDATIKDLRTGEAKTLSGELANTYEELSLLYRLSASMTIAQPPREFFGFACRELQTVLGVKWLALQLIDGQPQLEELSSSPFVAGDAGVVPQTLRRLGLQLILRFGQHTQPVLVEEAASIGLPVLPSAVNNLLVVPLRSQNGPVGVLFGGDRTDGKPLTSSDAKLCDSLANSLTIYTQNLVLYEDMHGMFVGTLQALTSAIDAKDSYTHGHSERVAMVAKQLAQQIGFDANTVERTPLSGLVHDVGKIGVPESVLTKPGRLTAEEFDQIKRHPEIGARILQGIAPMQDLIPGVLHHHERWDGGGYPYGLTGKDIPLFGRVLCLADSFDAMTSDRTYRAGRPLDATLEEIKRCAGTQFDPELAAAFVEIEFDPYYQLIQTHQQQTTRRSA